ncbi:MAG: glycine betaine ABC transporter substrate-binding protein [Roseovarius sp.]
MKSTCCAFALCAVVFPVIAADMGESDGQIKLALTHEISARITAHVAGELLVAVATDGGAPLLMDYPSDWDGPGADLMTALDLPFTTTSAASEQALVETLVRASSTGTPALAMFWEPHWAVAAHDLRFVALPEAEAACFQEPGWGPNPNAVGDCGFPAITAVKAVIKGFKHRWPAAYVLIETFRMDNETLAPLLIAVERDGRPVAEVAAEWVAANDESWRPLVEGATN